MRHEWVSTGYLAGLVALVALGLRTGGAMTGQMALLIAALIAGSSYSLIAYTMLQTMVKGFDQTIRRLSGTN